MRATSDGIINARIGMSAPTFRSPITGIGDGQVLKWINTGGNFNGYLSVGAIHTNTGSAGSDTRIYMGTNSASKVDIRDWSDTVYMSVLKSGNVGIGTTSPVTTLDVVGDATITKNVANQTVTLLKLQNNANSSSP